jgi:hypothetical protein
MGESLKAQDTAVQLIRSPQEPAKRIQLLGSDYFQFAVELEHPLDEVHCLPEPSTQ